MNSRSLEVIKETYKPFKITILGKVQILDSTSGKIVLKEKKNNIRELYDYLKSRSFSCYPELIDDSKEDINIFEYAEDIYIPEEQKSMDFIKVIGLLHQKTTYYKDVNKDEFKKIYNNILDEINYLTFFYENKYETYFKSIYPSPSEYLLLTNTSKILSSLGFSKRELESWYQKTEKLTRYRICQIHNNLSLEHFHKNNKDTILSWENSRKDSPVLDLIKFYKCSYFNLNFETILENYWHICPWSEEEKQLFFLMISLPPKFVDKGSEFEKVKKIREVLDYIYKTETLIRPYYTVKEEKK